MLTACISFGVAMTTNTHFRGEELKKVWLNRYPADVLWGSDQFWAEFVQPGRTCKPCVARGVVI